MHPGADPVSSQAAAPQHIGATIFGCAGLSLSPAETAFFQRCAPWGFILFARNVESPSQLRALCDALRDSVGRDAPIFIDQEGGRVARMRAPQWREWPPARDQVLSLPREDAERVMYLRARLIAAELRACGIDGNCAPLADIARPETHGILHNRCYGDDLETVTIMARAIANGCLDGGVLPVLKHIPGHGRAQSDSHLELPRVSAPRAALDASDFAAFAALADLPLAMSAHVVFDALDPEHCATHSAPAIAAIRGQMGFDGLLMTDDVSMQALEGPMQSRCLKALEAGCDLILHCNGDMAEMAPVAEASGTLTPAAAARAARAIAARQPPAPFDIEAADAEYQRLTGVHV
ncbi:MAG: beta-hexosaminidase [Mangrovicoccus sp.]|nr:beta-hexosaminidase [Mangrovicoccus sp.]